ncbi:hypothetical protein GWI33_016230 [Rhynchophorus ferrugineus]|uniref:Uncharacterized protein n=1 Tax=Rhynchophorus ferrugineus TaxID=354439 RepID=A0A834M556_RHYFE|nr:hypothetical protein GWI33_016230 [Rhynchophorus ferrugineus]
MNENDLLLDHNSPVNSVRERVAAALNISVVALFETKYTKCIRSRKLSVWKVYIKELGTCNFLRDVRYPFLHSYRA